MTPLNFVAVPLSYEEIGEIPRHLGYCDANVLQQVRPEVAPEPLDMVSREDLHRLTRSITAKQSIKRVCMRTHTNGDEKVWP